MTVLVSWNVNGLRAVAKKGFLETIADMSADIFCLQEIKAREEQLPAEIRAVAGYESWFNPAERPGYSGVAVYAKAKPEAVRKGLGIERFDSEGRLLELDFEKFRLINCYFPNGGSGEARLAYKMDFYEALLRHVRGVEKPLLLCGDVNTAHKETDLARPRENSGVSGFLPMERAWIDELLAAGFYDTFRLFNNESGHYSWWDYKTGARERNVGWRIDYFFANRAMLEHLRDAWIWPRVVGSDHCPVGVRIDL
ncbi:MAG: exodeoxyribonuclease III [Clostridiales bacterium]|nr:exodeoxyribonuclease III [Clostridiales bacterium]